MLKVIYPLQPYSIFHGSSLFRGNRGKYKKICDPVIFPKKNIKNTLYFSIISKIPPPPIDIELSGESFERYKIHVKYFPRTLQYSFSYVHVLFNPHFCTFHSFAKKSVKQLVSKGEKLRGKINWKNRQIK